MLYREWEPITECIQRLGPISPGLLLTIGFAMLVKRAWATSLGPCAKLEVSATAISWLALRWEE